MVESSLHGNPARKPLVRGPHAPGEPRVLRVPRAATRGVLDAAASPGGGRRGSSLATWPQCVSECGPGAQPGRARLAFPPCTPTSSNSEPTVAWEVGELKGSECGFRNQRAWIRISALPLIAPPHPTPLRLLRNGVGYDIVRVSGPLHVSVGSPAPCHTSSRPQHLSLGLPPACPSAGTFALCIVSGPLWPLLGHCPCHSLRSQLRLSLAMPDPFTSVSA